MSLPINYKDEIKKEYRNFENYLFQALNIADGTLRLGWWCLCTVTVVIASIAMIVFLFFDFQLPFNANVNVAVLRNFLEMIFVFILGIGVVLNKGEFRNVFSGAAEQRIERYKAVKTAFDNRVKDIESVLVKYGLIKRTASSSADGASNVKMKEGGQI